MSGIEVASLVLGAIPVVVEGLNAILKCEKAFRRRKTLTRVANELELQKYILVKTVEQVLFFCDCVAPSELTTEFLNRDDVQIKIRNGLGHAEFALLSRCAGDLLKAIEDLTFKIARFVPAVRNSPSITPLVMKNGNFKQGKPDFWSKLRIAFSITDLESNIEHLKSAGTALGQFVKHISPEDRLPSKDPTSTAKQLARRCWQIRSQSSSLYAAISSGWHPECPLSHRARMFLEHDRCTDLITRSLRRRLNASKIEPLPFQIMFLDEEHSCWHEANITVERDSDWGDGPRDAKVTFDAPVQPVNIEANLATVQNLCVAMHKPASGTASPGFRFAESNDVHLKVIFTKQLSCDITRYSSLYERLQNGGTNYHLKMKARLIVACKLAAAFLELLRTKWTDNGTLAERVEIFAQDCHLFLSLEFPAAKGPSNVVVLEDLLVELGILLLEVWYAVTLEDKYPQVMQDATSMNRKGCASKWLRDDDDPLPCDYQIAVSRCVDRLDSKSPILPPWDAPAFREAYCEGILLPLLKLKEACYRQP